MGSQIFKQTKTDALFVTDEGEEVPFKEGLFAIYSTTTGEFCGANFTEEDVVEYFAERAAEMSRLSTRHELKLLKEGSRRSRNTFEDRIKNTLADPSDTPSIRLPKKGT